MLWYGFMTEDDKMHINQYIINRLKEEDIKEFREKIYPYWKGKSLEDAIKGTYGIEINKERYEFANLYSNSDNK